LNTGFLSTPFLCQILAEYGYIAEAENVLLQEECPGWLYEVKKGATTIWENWDGLDETGKVKASLNHYSYGAIAGWLIRSVCGIRQEGQRITIKPTVLPKLGHAEATYTSPVGTIESGWQCREDGSVLYIFRIPPNTQARFLAQGQEMILEPGTHHISL
jgi:alpha-L-rhamnosidase